MDADTPQRTRRTLQACRTCRRRKTKCNGVRPRCYHCTSRDIPCIWPPSATDVTADLDSGNSPSVPSRSSAQLAAEPPFTERRALRRCIDIFFERDLACIFCSFIHKPDLEGASTDSMSFLTTAIICLCARYLSPKEAEEDFGLSSGVKVCRRFTPAAKAMARATSDEPSVQNIQGNLVLALSELLDNAGSSHWMYAGTAIRMAQVMRLNQDYHQTHSLKDQEIRRRTFWACLMADKLLAYFLTKPCTMSLVNVAVALPSTDASLAYQETTRGLTLSNLSSFSGYPSEIGILPYFIKTITLWSDIVDINVCHSRFVAKTLPPTDPASSFFQRHQDMQDWEAALPTGFIWNRQNHANHSGLGQGREFVAMHVLIRSSFCVAHQAYLPQLDGSSVLIDIVDAVGWSLLHREPALLAKCVTNALSVGKMLSKLMAESVKIVAELQSVWVASALLSVSNVFLWLQYANDPDYADEDTVESARRYFSLVTSLLLSWTSSWKAARQWLKALKGMEAMYRAAYLGQIEEEEFVLDNPGAGTSASEGEDEQEAGVTPSFRPRAGDGYPPLAAIPNLYASLRFLASDTSAEPKRLQSVWMRFASGWTHNDLVTGMMCHNGSFEQQQHLPPLLPPSPLSSTISLGRMLRGDNWQF